MALDLTANSSERRRLEEAGEVDEVGDLQPELPPALTSSLVGTVLEVRWRYWEKVTDPKDKRKKKAADIWCEGEVVQVADGVVKKSSQSKEPLPEGAVRLKWAADAEFEEEESYTWSILHPENWNTEAVLGWRFASSELQKRRERGTQGKSDCV